MSTPNGVEKDLPEHPIPPGAKIIDITLADPKRIKEFARRLSWHFPPEQRKVIEKVFKL